MRILIIIFLFVLSYSNTEASHFLGYDMQLINIKDTNNNPTHTYKWRLRFYRDVTGVPMPTTLLFNVFQKSNNASVGNFNMNKINPQTFISYSNTICAPAQSQNKIELGIFESPAIDYITMNSAEGYYVSSAICCRNPGIANISGESSNHSAILYAYFPKLVISAPTQFNSSPYFSQLPVGGFTVGKQYDLNWSAIDPDGDSLAYSMVLPREGGQTAPTFQDLAYFEPYYSINGNIADGNPDFRVHPTTGMITFKPTKAGKYLVAVVVEEFRVISGVLTKIGEIRRELQIQTYHSTDNAPILYDSLANSTIFDTIDVRNLQNTYTKELIFNSSDEASDSVYIKIIPEISSQSNNILDTNLIDVTWSDLFGNTLKGTDAENFIVRGLGNAQAKLSIKVDSNNASTLPYKFKIVSYDNSCQWPLTDTVYYELLVRGNECYSTIQSIYSACDSIELNGVVFYQSTVLSDTVKSTIGCDVVNITFININETPEASFVDLSIYVTDTSKLYAYKVDTHSNATYQWYTSGNGNIVSGANSNEVLVKWNTDTTMEAIYCFIFSGNCLDSLSSPIVISHIVGFENERVSEIKVYPNPATDIIKFNTNLPLENTYVKIYNTLGQIVQESSVQDNALNIAGIPAGVYHFVLMNKDMQVRGKVVKK